MPCFTLGGLLIQCKCAQKFPLPSSKPIYIPCFPLSVPVIGRHLGIGKVGKNLILGAVAGPLRRRWMRRAWISSWRSPLRGAPEITHGDLQTNLRGSCLPVSAQRVAHFSALSCSGLCVLPCVMHGKQEKINHQELLTPCKPWHCSWSCEDGCRWNSTSYRVWQLSRGAISFCSLDKTRSIGRGSCPPLSAWIAKAPNASVLMGVILKVSGKQLALFIDPGKEGKHAPISNFLMSSSIGKNAMAQGIGRFFTV